MNRFVEKAFCCKPDYMPLCVVKVRNTDEVSGVLKYCYKNDISVIPRTGASSSEGQLAVINDNTIFLDASPIRKLISLDEENMMVTVGCGMPLSELEEMVNEKGLTTGHCPQSQPLADMGGLVSTRSIGQFSTYYGGIEDMVCGLEAVLPDGKIIRIRNVPRRAAGPDLKQLFIGSEGTYGVVTEITVKLFTWYPDNMWKRGYVVKSFDTGIDVIREILVKGYRPSVVRLYDKADVDLNYGSVNIAPGEAFMFFVAEGPEPIANATGEAIAGIANKFNAKDIGTEAVEHWWKTRNNLCDDITSGRQQKRVKETKVLYATMEISASWSDIKKIYHDVMDHLPNNIPELVLLGGHVSHSYQNGTNIYFVYQVKINDPSNGTEEMYRVVEEICNCVLKQETGGIVHHHGMGKLRVRLADKEHGSSYVLLENLKHMMDPKGIMNPGDLVQK